MRKYIVLLLLAAGMTIEAMGLIAFTANAVVTWDPAATFFVGGLAAHIALISLSAAGVIFAGHMASEFIDELKD